MANEEDSRGVRRERDMILAPNEFAFISDETKGEVNAFVGPNKQSLAGTDRCVTFDLKTKRFRPTTLDAGVQTFQTAPEGWYVVLKNPAENDKHPAGNGKLSTPNLRVGKKVNISGPASFPLWPGQMAKVVQGHSLRSNEYLLVRVYDEEAAKLNWGKAVIKTAPTDGVDAAANNAADAAAAAAAAQPGAKQQASDIPSEKDLSMGKQFIIRGTEVSFYIPPTGIEVIPERINGEERYVREAVSLERLEYCLLLDQDGNKRYVRGPAVVFPRPTEKFVEAPIKSNPEKAKAKKFRAQELTPTSGIHIRVIADYVDEGGQQHKAGDELFITGAEQPVYFPREEHAIIKYGEQDVHYGIAIPSGEARYVLDRETGVISLEKGPKIFLADPRKQVIAQRALPLPLCELLYPGNQEALQINADRLGVGDQDIMGVGGANAAFLNSSYVRSADQDEAYAAVAATVTPDTNRRILIRSASKSLPGDAFDRKSKFTAPRSVILNTKYDGVVAVTLWTGFAMLLIRKSGERRVVQGPGTFMLEYDESPQVLTLSRGKPKNMDNPLRTVYLQTTSNLVSDIVEVETRDFCRLNVKVSYRVNFEGAAERWFSVDNYVKFLCDHMRSRIRSAVQKYGIEDFYGNHTEILRDIILGEAPDAADASQPAKRPGTSFDENGMRIYDADILGITMQNADVEKMLVAAQRNTIQNTLSLADAHRKQDFEAAIEQIKRDNEQSKADTEKLLAQLREEAIARKLRLEIKTIDAGAETQARTAAAELESTKAKAAVTALLLEQRKASSDVDVALEKARMDIKLEELDAQVKAVVDKAAAITPDLIAALDAFGERGMVEKAAEAMAPLSLITGGKRSVVEVLGDLLKGTDLASQLKTAVDKAPAKRAST